MRGLVQYQKNRRPLVPNNDNGTLGYRTVAADRQ
jgi:hypothetical protein